LAVVGVLLLLGMHVLLDRAERSYQKLFQERSALYSSWLPAIQAAEESRALRDNEKLLAQTLGSNRIGDLEWIALFKALSRLTHPDLLLHSVNLQKDKGKWLITLKGQVVSRDGYAAQVAFNRFYQGLKSSPYFKEIELLPLNVVTVREKVGGPAKKASEGSTGPSSAEVPAGTVEISKTKVEFELRAQAREA